MVTSLAWFLAGLQLTSTLCVPLCRNPGPPVSTTTTLSHYKHWTREFACKNPHYHVCVDTRHKTNVLKHTAKMNKRQLTHTLAVPVINQIRLNSASYLAAECRLVANTHERRLHSTERRTCVVTRTHNTFADRVFAAAGPGIWNSLQPHLRDADLPYSRFQRSLKTFLFGQ